MEHSTLAIKLLHKLHVCNIFIIIPLKNSKVADCLYNQECENLRCGETVGSFKWTENSIVNYSFSVKFKVYEFCSFCYFVLIFIFFL